MDQSILLAIFVDFSDSEINYSNNLNAYWELIFDAASQTQINDELKCLLAVFFLSFWPENQEFRRELLIQMKSGIEYDILYLFPWSLCLNCKV